MKSSFGTDGIRGKANDTLTVDIAYKIGRYLGYYFNGSQRPKVVIGKDPRLSSSMLEAALSAGCLESGADVYQVGFTSTPSISYLVSHDDFCCGIMISASHNPYYDNGIKVFAHNGTKLEREIEELIENYIENGEDIARADSESIGRLVEYSQGIDLYLEHLISIVKPNLSQFKLALDLANGSNSYTVKKLLAKLKVEVDCFNYQPDGININNGCGSTHIEHLQQIVVDGGYDIGFAFDGDADRVLAVNSAGSLVDGDAFMYIFAKYLNKVGELSQSTVVTTVMSNLGLFKALKEQNLVVDITAVGDKYVFDSMVKNGYDLGGEQSGHIILKKYANTGDGLLSALVLLDILANEDKNLDQLLADLVIYPQVLENVRVKDKKIVEDVQLIELIKTINASLDEDGRVLVRTSGTEPLIRVMVEAKTMDLCQQYVSQMVNLIKEKDQALA